jgi:FixJ family two-component response regulator
MKIPALINNSKATIAILSVSPDVEDNGALENIFRQDSQSDRKWKLVAAPTLEWAANMLRLSELPIVLCDHDLQPGTWKELVDRTALMTHSPLVIVTSRFADERMWAEVLNLGAWDLLEKPFNRAEVIRIVDSAWRHWKDRYESAARADRWLRAAG